jgi:hypothetical protein
MSWIWVDVYSHRAHYLPVNIANVDFLERCNTFKYYKSMGESSFGQRPQAHAFVHGIALDKYMCIEQYNVQYMKRQFLVPFHTYKCTEHSSAAHQSNLLHPFQSCNPQYISA